MSEENKLSFRALREESKAAIKILFAECFPDDD